MDMRKRFRKSTQQHAPQAAMLFDKFHILRHLGEAMDKVRKAECSRHKSKAEVHQGTEIRLAGAPGKSHQRGSEKPETAAGCQQTVE